MIRLLLERLSWAIAFTVVLAFFLPWLKIKSHGDLDQASSEQTKQELVEEADLSWLETYFTLRPNELRDALFEPLSGTNGMSLLWLARSDREVDREKAHKLGMFLGSSEPREIAVLIYALPAFTLIGACFFTAAPAGRWLFLIPCCLCTLLYALLRSRLSETYFDRSVLELSAGLGLWISLYGLLAMAVLLGLRTIWGVVKK